MCFSEFWTRGVLNPWRGVTPKARVTPQLSYTKRAFEPSFQNYITYVGLHMECGDQNRHESIVNRVLYIGMTSFLLFLLTLSFLLSSSSFFITSLESRQRFMHRKGFNGRLRAMISSCTRAVTMTEGNSQNTGRRCGKLANLFG